MTSYQSSKNYRRPMHHPPSPLLRQVAAWSVGLTFCFAAMALLWMWLVAPMSMAFLYIAPLVLLVSLVPLGLIVVVTPLASPSGQRMRNLFISLMLLPPVLAFEALAVLMHF